MASKCQQVPGWVSGRDEPSVGLQRLLDAIWILDANCMPRTVSSSQHFGYRWCLSASHSFCASPWLPHELTTPGTRSLQLSGKPQVTGPG
ncbi:hypothetical protein J1614_001978 [Plenodomus biglobosus]|nr:hypothetical protein J1614_001978 [Plenodomus biglobosus]